MDAGPLKIPDQLRFGEDFELDLRSYELRRAGHVLQLERIPMDLLLLLVEKRGQIVTRDQIIERIWGNDAFLDTDNSINAAIREIRQALKDDPEQPRFVETITGRGYRFLAAVVEVMPPPAPGTANAHAPAIETLAGQQVSHYRILQVLGGGGMGVVYKAEDLKLRRKVAIKFLPAGMASDPNAFERLQLEARAASSLEHPNICPIYELGEHVGQPFIVMQLLEGETLQEKIGSAGQQNKPLPTQELVDLALQIAAGLEAAHEKGIIHRDIKPANIFITSRHEAKILDFGLAKIVDPDLATNQAAEQPALSETAVAATPTEAFSNLRLTRTGTAVGTAHYMSPEQVRGETLDARTDVFSFGLVLYEMATGQRAFSGNTATMIHHAILHLVPPPIRQLNPAISAGLEPIICKATEKDRDLRYQSAADMRTDLRRLQRDSESGQRSAARSGKVAVADAPAARVAKFWKIAVPFLLAAVLVSGGLYYRVHQQSKHLTETDSIVLADFSNSTGDAIFDDTLKRALVVALTQSPFLNILPDSKVSATLKQMTRPVNTPLTAAVTREVCQRTGSEAYVAGAIAFLGSDYVVGLKAVNCQTGDTLAQEQSTATGKEKVIGALGDAAAKLRGQLGESLVTVQKFDVPLFQATTSSLEALKEASLGYRAENEIGPAEARPHFEKAVALDPNFAVAYTWLALESFDLGEASLAAKNATKAYELRDRTTERERLNINAVYHTFATGNLEKAAQAYELMADSYPRAASPHGNLGYIYAQLGQNEKFLAESQHALRLNPSGQAYSNVAAAYMSLSRLKEAKATSAEARAHHLGVNSDHNNMYLVAFLEHDKATMEREAAWAMGKPGVEDWMLYFESCTSAYSGGLKKAREISRRAWGSAAAAGEKETAAGYQADAALREAQFGNASEARKLAPQALAASRGQDVEAASALAYALAGDVARAQSLADEMAKRFPDNTVVQFTYLPVIRGQIEVASGNPAQAIQSLRVAAPYELGQPAQNILLNLYPVYVRGEAYLAVHDGPAAAAEFQKIPDHSGIIVNQNIGALAHLQLGRAYVLEGEADKARSAYKDFLTLWKDADPEIPILKQAKAEYARLE